MPSPVMNKSAESHSAEILAEDMDGNWDPIPNVQGVDCGFALIHDEPHFTIVCDEGNFTGSYSSRITPLPSPLLESPLDELFREVGARYGLIVESVDSPEEYFYTIQFRERGSDLKGNHDPNDS